VATLSVQSLSISLPGGQSLCRDLSFEVGSGQVLALTGPSGSGKSSILAWLTGTLDPQLPHEGRAFLDQLESDGSVYKRAYQRLALRIWRIAIQRP